MDGEELRGTEGRETVIRIYFMRKESIFNKRGERKIHIFDGTYF